MALFGRGNKDAVDPKSAGAETHPLVGRRVYCRICGDERQFTRCWRRTAMVRACTSCGLHFENPRALYAKFQPACPQCAEPLEQPGFDYGFCDGCGSKYEIMEGTRPGLLPN